SRLRHYTAICTRAFWPGCAPDDLAEMVVAEFDLDESGSPANVRSPAGQDPLDHQEWFCFTAIARIQELLALTLRGIYWIGAIRPIEHREHVQRAVFDDSKIIRARYVGGHGEYTQALARKFAYNEMRLAGNQEHGSIKPRFTQAISAVHAELIA